MGILQVIMLVLGITNTAISTMGNAQKAFSGKKGSGKAKKKLVLDVAKVLVEKSKLKPAEKKALLKETSKTIDTVAKTANIIKNVDARGS